MISILFTENEMLPTKPENPRPLKADGRESLPGPVHSPPVIEVPREVQTKML